MERSERVRNRKRELIRAALEAPRPSTRLHAIVQTIREKPRGTDELLVLLRQRGYRVTRSRIWKDLRILCDRGRIARDKRGRPWSIGGGSEAAGTLKSSYLPTAAAARREVIIRLVAARPRTNRELVAELSHLGYRVSVALVSTDLWRLKMCHRVEHDPKANLWYLFSRARAGWTPHQTPILTPEEYSHFIFLVNVLGAPNPIITSSLNSDAFGIGSSPRPRRAA